MNVKDKTVCVTGVLAGITREEAAAALTKLGAKVTGSVSKNTHVLFVGAQAGSKLDKALALGVEIADEKALLSLLGKKVDGQALAERANEDLQRRSLEQKALQKSAAPPTGLSLRGKTVVVTGTLSVERAEMEALLAAAGAKVSGSVSKNTHVLVVGAGAGSKLVKAKALGIEILNEAQARAAAKRK